MQKLNYKIILGALVLVAVVILAVATIPRTQEKKTEPGSSKDTVEQALEEVGVKTEAAESVFSFINPYSKSGEIEYLAPKDDAIASNVGGELKDKTLVVKSINIQSGLVSAKPTEIAKPLKVVWGSDGSIAYLTTDKKAFYVNKDRSRPIKISDNAIDVALSDESELVAVVDGQAVMVFATGSQPSVLATFESTGRAGSSVATDEGIVFKSRAGWESYTRKTGVRKTLDAKGDIIGQYSAGDFVVIGSSGNSYIYNYKDESQIATEGDINPGIVLQRGNGTIFASVKPGQSEDKTALTCFNHKTGSLLTLYTPATDIESFEASSGTIQGNVFYFTWGLSLSSLKINSRDLQKCTN